mgnify:FL=1
MAKDRLNVKISVAGRLYPMTITPESEELIRNSAKKIDETIKKYQQNYEVKDKTDGLAMSALEFCVANESKNHIRSSVVDQSINELRELNQLVEDHI